MVQRFCQNWSLNAKSGQLWDGLCKIGLNKLSNLDAGSPPFHSPCAQSEASFPDDRHFTCTAGLHLGHHSGGTEGVQQLRSPVGGLSTAPLLKEIAAI